MYTSFAGIGNMKKEERAPVCNIRLKIIHLKNTQEQFLNILLQMFNFRMMLLKEQIKSIESNTVNIQFVYKYTDTKYFYISFNIFFSSFRR